MILLALAGAGCQKLNQSPGDKYTDANYWTTPANASALLNTAYMQMYGSDVFFYNEGLSDNCYCSRGDQDGAFSIASGSFNTNNGRFESEWSGHYSGIKSCNVLLDNVDKVPNYPVDQKDSLIAQARFIRAFQYWQLMTWFGDVPLFDHDITLEESQTIPRTPRAQVLAFVLSELNAAQAVLPASWDAADLGRITRGACMALKARVQLYEGNWAAVASICDSLIASQTYALVPNYANIFSITNEHNSEVILDEEFVPTQRMYGWTFDLIPISAGARDNALGPTQSLVDDYLMMNGDTVTQAGSGFDPNNPYVSRDPRMTATLVYHLYNWTVPGGASHTIYIKPGSDTTATKHADEYVPNGGFGSATGYYWRKYFDWTAQPGENSGLDLILIRYADVLLMDAEAKNELGQFTAANWTQTIGALRTRAGFTDPNATQFNAAWTQGQLRAIIRRERRCELALEGLRVFDIRRWRTSEVVMNGTVHGAMFGDPSVDGGYIRVGQRIFNPARDYLWPIPLYEMQQNSHLTQNPNY
ncbi:RagB/SusD family nutrient uptake outer membrane protein [Dinghuibacter silviterrae]|uniref:RagB/SusD family nutrient uptake outer membrane protein n=1 Tax=Dinghuibacter silviterrae TaxID=1539049 RepID=UPI001FE4BD8F|nr:RagB/SusD family nutrient uptake outer membrane protein [Dinghuibacter silviterrae]